VQGRVTLSIPKTDIRTIGHKQSEPLVRSHPNDVK
jgi:hypothetical protein